MTHLRTVELTKSEEREVISHPNASYGGRDLPAVSVVMPVLNEGRYIENILRHIAHQDYPAELIEVVVADSGSDDETLSICASHASGLNLRVLRLAEKGRSQGLNAAIQASTGDFIVRLDCRCEPARDYISRCVETILATGADNVGGVQSPLFHSVSQRGFACAMSHPFGVGNSQFRLGRKSGLVDTVYLGCFKRDVFERVGYFDADSAVISEDSDLNQRIRESGGRVYLNHEIRVGYYPRETFSAFAKLYFRYGGARAGNLLKHGNLTSLRQVIAPAFLLILLAFGLASPFSELARNALVAVCGIYVAVDAVVSVTIAFQQKSIALLPRLLVAFPFMHFAWAAGFWKRLVVPSKTFWAN